MPKIDTNTLPMKLLIFRHNCYLPYRTGTRGDHHAHMNFYPNFWTRHWSCSFPLCASLWMFILFLSWKRRSHSQTVQQSFHIPYTNDCECPLHSSALHIGTFLLLALRNFQTIGKPINPSLNTLTVRTMLSFDIIIFVHLKTSKHMQTKRFANSSC